MKKQIIYSFIIVAAFFVSSCDYDMLIIEGSGEISTEILEVEDFNGINMLGAEDVVISYGEEQEVLVIGDDNIIDLIKTDVHGGIWNIELEHGRYRNYELKYYITLPRINEIHNDGAAKVLVNDFVNEGDLHVSINGAGDMEFYTMENVENLYISIDGVGNIKLKEEFPELQYLDIYINGSGSVSAYPALTNDCYIEIDGAARCNVSVEDNLDVFIDGAGVVNYQGYPDVSQHISGLGLVNNKN